MKEEMINLSDLPQDEFRCWQLKLLEILVYFRDFCTQHNLKFCISAGTCLGAVRHKGFIPWDDDVDVVMPRKDYDKLYELWNKYADLDKFKCCKTTESQSVGFPMIVIRSENTTCIYEHSMNWDICHGLKIDVEHLDGMPKVKYKQIIQIICFKLIALLRTQRIPNQKTKFVKLISRILLMFFSSPKWNYRIANYLEKHAIKFDYEASEYVRYLALPPMKKEIFDEIIWVEFENTTMPIPKKYDDYLKSQYGNYMELPPVEKRKPLTKCVFYDLKNSYKKYKGIHYCKNRK